MWVFVLIDECVDGQVEIGGNEWIDGWMNEWVGLLVSMAVLVDERVIEWIV